MKKIMFYFLVGLFVAFLSVMPVSIAEASVLTFDDITSDRTTLMPKSYEGFNWKNPSLVVSNSVFERIRSPLRATSGKYTNVGRFSILEKTNGTSFDFNGANFANINPFTGGGLYTLGIKNGKLLNIDHHVGISNIRYNWITADYMDIDRLIILSDSRGLWSMDDFTTNKKPSVAALVKPIFTDITESFNWNESWLYPEIQRQWNKSKYELKYDSPTAYYSALQVQPIFDTLRPENFDNAPAPVPDPSTVLLMGLGLCLISRITKRKYTESRLA